MTPNSKCVLTQHPLHSVYPHNTHFTVCTHTTSKSKCVQPQHPVQSVYPYNIHFSVYPHNIQFKVCTPITSTSVSTHTTSTSQWVLTQHPLHSEYPHNVHFTVCTHTSTSQCVPTQHLPTAHLVFSGRSLAASQSGLMMHTHFPLRGWTIYPDSQGWCTDAHPLYPVRVDHIPTESRLMNWCTTTLPWESGPHTHRVKADVLMHNHFTLREWTTYPQSRLMYWCTPTLPWESGPHTHRVNADVLMHTHFTLREWTTYPQSRLMYTHFTPRGWTTHPDN